MNTDMNIHKWVKDGVQSKRKEQDVKTTIGVEYLRLN